MTSKITRAIFEGISGNCEMRSFDAEITWIGDSVFGHLGGPIRNYQGLVGLMGLGRLPLGGLLIPI